jgi:inner membrane protein
MDPITHSLAGAALSRAGYHRATPLATATLVLAANAPDIDILTSLGGPYATLAHRRGWTHGPLALFLLPFAVAGGVLLYDRWIRRRSNPAAPPAHAVPLVLLAVLGVATHPLLDWMNNYGVRLLMPFSGRWYYGDALFIVDPWVWLMLGAAVFLARRAAVPKREMVGWGAFTCLASLLVLAGPVPVVAKGGWVVGVVAILATRIRGSAGGSERAARWGLGAAVLYITLMVVASRAAAGEVRRALEGAGVGEVREVMVAPEPANPFRGSVVASTASAYHLGTFQWLGRPRFVQSESIPTPRASAVTEAAAATPEGERYLTWSRFPFFEVREVSGGGYVVRIRDARYADVHRAGGLSGVTVRLDRELRAVPRGAAPERAAPAPPPATRSSPPGGSGGGA